MKVLLAYSNNNAIDNPFVYTLKKGLEAEGCSVDWGLEQFWENYMHYDVIHINWPNSLFESWNPTKVEVLYLEKVILDIKLKGIKIIYTRHNEKPHYSSNQNILKCYKLVEENADAIVYLGNKDFEDNCQSDDKKCVVIPHHIYDIYNTDINEKEARRQLGIPENKFVILTFGAYRDQEEISMVLNTYKGLKIKNKYLLAPRLSEALRLNTVYQGIGRQWLLKKREKLKLKWHDIHISDGFISDNELPLYFKSSDVVLIQRKDILNSGNLPLAYLFGKIVIGPNSGNVKEILEETNNFIFDPNSEGSLINSLNKVYDLNREELGEKNREYALSNWNLKDVAKKYIALYNEIYE